jgi:hypothetical protein
LTEGIVLSSATLFHFTDSLDKLRGILSTGFKPSYSPEDLTMFGIKQCPGIPMVCFCDIPLSQTQSHVGHYGRYAIGLKKQWGKSKNISPVHYIYEDSICATVVRRIFDALPPDKFGVNCRCMQFDLDTAIFFYGKPYSGTMVRRNRSTGALEEKGTLTFYDEREWRYVPFADEAVAAAVIPSDVRSLLSEHEWTEPEVVQSATAKLQSLYKLEFGADDVSYIIVKEESEIAGMVEFVEEEMQRSPCNLALTNCTRSEKRRLASRVISMSQIEQDF